MKRLVKILLVLFILLMLAFVIFRTPDTDAAEMRAKYGGEPSQFVELSDGLIVHLRDEGPKDAPAIVLLHGSSADLHTWEPWVEALRGDYRLIRYDQIGHGLTGPALDDNYGLEDYTNDINAVADQLGLKNFVLVGSSMAGWISINYALEHSDRLNGLVIVGGSGAPIEREEAGNLAYAIVSTPGVRELTKYITPRNLIEKSLKQSVSNQSVVTPAAVDRYWELLRYPGNREATLNRLGQPRETYSAEQIGGMAVPTLLMWGDEDRLVPLEMGHWYDSHLPNAQLVSYPGIGHLPMEEAPARSIADLREWLLTLPLSSETQG